MSAQVTLGKNRETGKTAKISWHSPHGRDRTGPFWRPPQALKVPRGIKTPDGIQECGSLSADQPRRHPKNLRAAIERTFRVRLFLKQGEPSILKPR